MAGSATVERFCMDCNGAAWLGFLCGIAVATLGYVALHHFLKD